MISCIPSISFFVFGGERDLVSPLFLAISNMHMENVGLLLHDLLDGKPCVYNVPCILFIMFENDYILKKLLWLVLNLYHTAMTIIVFV